MRQWQHKWVSALVSGLLLTPAGGLQACEHYKGSYRLVDEERFQFIMLPPNSQTSAVEIARAMVSYDGETVMQGYLTSSQGFSVTYFVPDNPQLKDSNIALSFVDQKMKLTTDSAQFMIIQNLGSTLYYGDRELWGKYPLQGDVWKRAKC